MKLLNGMTMRMVWEAKSQLASILVNAGFPEQCMTSVCNQVCGWGYCRFIQVYGIED